MTAVTDMTLEELRQRHSELCDEHSAICQTSRILREYLKTATEDPAVDGAVGDALTRILGDLRRRAGAILDESTVFYDELSRRFAARRAERSFARLAEEAGR